MEGQEAGRQKYGGGGVGGGEVVASLREAGEERVGSAITVEPQYIKPLISQTGS